MLASLRSTLSSSSAKPLGSNQLSQAVAGDLAPLTSPSELASGSRAHVVSVAGFEVEGVSIAGQVHPKINSYTGTCSHIC